MLKKIPFIFLLLWYTAGFTQTTLPVPLNIQHTYNIGTRTESGAPGKNYWQNHADYTIKVNFDPKSRLLDGTVSIDYTNNSPDTLTQVWFKLYPNLFKKGSVRNMPIHPEDINEGVRIKKLSVNQQDQDIEGLTIEGTNMIVKVPELLPNHHIHFDIDYNYVLNQTSHIRTGQVDTGQCR